ncbi:UDP-2,3-diacylglucosamine diphosphatase [Alkalilimnicola sp. S0819]|nr:UDP-2,3-diacylglucosamine diphosphatase [Alkalilimnicola sp. S0819]MPQ17458.1 UDP-2,3-diacylglucosamine diphosphatase [Alkalilimnicola sp. S0819]
MPSYFISDLHLDRSRPAITDLFLRFLGTAAEECEALYILGDLFEAWIGDDAVGPEEPVIAGLAAFSARRPLYFLHGNRDFLIGERFAALTGAQLLPDPCVHRLYGRDVLLMHGDLLCTDDHEYQALRVQLRDPRWQQAFLARSIEERIAFARDAREKSSARNSRTEEYLMDVNQGTVERTLREHGVDRLIHGHTHRPAVHEFTLDGAVAQRIVLGDWYEQGSLLVYGPEGFELRQLPLP